MTTNIDMAPKQTKNLLAEDDPASRVVLSLPLLNPSLKVLTFTSYVPSSGFEERLAKSKDPHVRRITKKADALRSMTKDRLVQWETILAAFERVRDLEWLVKEALLHDGRREVSTRFEIAVNSLTPERLQELIDGLGGDEVLALCSVCRLEDGSVAHIPMMDYRCPPHLYNFRRVELSLKEMGQEGALLKSGRSYHFYGFQTLSHEDWVKFMGRSLLLAPLTDSRYIAHRLIAGTCVLRITANKDKPKVPHLYRIV